ncbi:MAG: 6-carboxytetrahydropterin synthase QueD [Chitinispirillaceae bacterium]|nr:6-carboxytetrahydropterin synthase QueD [Chitinispirillaceae bacterium]
MYEITSETNFSAAHRLKNYHGPCENVHGHNWLVRATVKCLVLDECGIGIDFKVLKTKLNEIVGRFDHQDLNAVLKESDMNPSSENIARHVFERLRESLQGRQGSVSRVEVFETPGNGAAYYE